jgi:hypothetical protein
MILNLRSIKQKHGEKWKDNSIVFRLLQNSKTTEKNVKPGRQDEKREAKERSERLLTGI